MRIVSKTGAQSLQHDGVTYTPKDGENAFEVPEDVGEHLVRFPHWVREYQADPDAASMAERIRALEAQSADKAPSDAEAALLARVAELEAQLARPAPEQATTKPAAKKAAAKKTAASKSQESTTADPPASDDTADDTDE